MIILLNRRLWGVLLFFFLLLNLPVFSQPGETASPAPTPGASPILEEAAPIRIVVAGNELTVPSRTLKPEEVLYVPLSGPEGEKLLLPLGATLSADEEKKTFTLQMNGRLVTLLPGEGKAQEKEKKILLVAPPLLVDGQLHVPLLSLPMFLGARLNYDEGKKIYYMDPLVTSVVLARESGQYRLVISATSSFQYKTFVLRNPDRFVVDIPNTFLMVPDQEILNEDVGKIRFAQFQVAPNITRIVIPLDVGLTVEPLPRLLTNQLTLALNVPSLRSPGQNFEPQEMRDISVEKTREGTVIKLTASGPFQYEWHRLREPDNRFYIDFPKMQLRSKERKFAIGEEYLSEIRAAQFQKEPFMISRVVLQLEKPVACYIRASDEVPNQLLITVKNEAIDPGESFYTGLGVTSFPVAEGIVVCLDPGHGGSDPGAINRGLAVYEKDINLDLAQRLCRILLKQGCNVVMTREDDRDVSYPGSDAREELGARVRVANDMKADVFISIHCNASCNGGVKGTSTHWCKPEDRPLASDILLSLEAEASVRGRGVQRNQFYVLRHSKMPAVLIETAFLSNYEEGRLLNDSDFREKVAEAIAAGLKNYLNRFKR